MKMNRCYQNATERCLDLDSGKLNIAGSLDDFRRSKINDISRIGAMRQSNKRNATMLTTRAFGKKVVSCNTEILL